MVGKSPSQAPGRGRGHVYSFCKDKRKSGEKTIQLKPLNSWSAPLTEVVVTM